MNRGVGDTNIQSIERFIQSDLPVHRGNRVPLPSPSQLPAQPCTRDVVRCMGAGRVLLPGPPPLPLG